MKRQRGRQWLALLLGVGVTLSMAGCLDGGGSGGDGGASGSANTDQSGVAKFADGTQITVVDQDGKPVPAQAVKKDNLNMVEISSPEYTYNIAPVGAYLFTQKVDKSVESEIEDLTYDSTTCEAFDEAIVGSLADFTADIPVAKDSSADGLFKPTPKKISSSNGQASATISDMHLKKDVTVAVTPYLGENFIPSKDHIASDIGASQATLVAGADISFSSNGTLTTAKEVCLSGKMTLMAKKQLTDEIVSEGGLRLVVYKDKKWQVVNAEVNVNSEGIEAKNVSAELRLYPFVFVQTIKASATFTVKGKVIQSAGVSGELVSPPTPGDMSSADSFISGVTVKASLPQVLDTLTVDNAKAMSTVVIGKAEDGVYEVHWQLLSIDPTGKVNYTNLLTNVTQASAPPVNGVSSLTIDDQVQKLMTADGKYLLKVKTFKESFGHEQQTGIVIKKGTEYAIQMNPTSTELLTTSNDIGDYAINGLLADYKTSYTLTASKKDAYQDSVQFISSSDDISSGTLTKDLLMQKVVVTTTTTTTSATTTTSMPNAQGINNALLNGNYAFVSAGNGSFDSGMGTVLQWWTSYGSMDFNGSGGWAESFTANFNQGSPIVGTLPVSGSGLEKYEVYQLTHLSLWGDDLSASATGGVDSFGHSGTAVFTKPDGSQREPVFFARLGANYNYSTALMDSNWFFVSYNPVGPYAGHDRVNFGSTDFSNQSGPNSNGNFIQPSGQISLSPGGSFTLPAKDQTGTALASPHDCSLSGSYNVAVCGQTKTAGQPVTVVGVKLGADTTYNPSSVAGVYHISGVIKNSANTQTREGILTLDGQGNWTSAMNWNSSAFGSGNDAPHGTYTYDGPAYPGRYTLTDNSVPTSPVTLYCGVSNDYSTVVCHDANTTGLVSIYMAVKASQQLP